MNDQVIHVAHSPDSDDAFMFYALASGAMDTGGLQFVHELKDIESLNQDAKQGRYEVTAVSIHAYAYLADRYALLDSGASMGEGYGPVLVAREPLGVERISSLLVAVPGERTSALLALKMLEPNLRYRVIDFDRIIPAVQAGEVDAGLIIHEGQLLYESLGLHCVVDLGRWWNQGTGLPLPLGGNVIRRDLGRERIHQVCRLLKESIRYALEHRDEALDYALSFGRGLGRRQGDQFVGMYVNQRTLSYGEEGRRAVRLFPGTRTFRRPDSPPARRRIRDLLTSRSRAPGC